MCTGCAVKKEVPMRVFAQAAELDTRILYLLAIIVIIIVCAAFGLGGRK
jgi:hypothetical protein